MLILSSGSISEIKHPLQLPSLCEYESISVGTTHVLQANMQGPRRSLPHFWLPLWRNSSRVDTTYVLLVVLWAGYCSALIIKGLYWVICLLCWIGGSCNTAKTSSCFVSTYRLQLWWLKIQRSKKPAWKGVASTSRCVLLPASCWFLAWLYLTMKIEAIRWLTHSSCCLRGSFFDHEHGDSAFFWGAAESSTTVYGVTSQTIALWIVYYLFQSSQFVCTFTIYYALSHVSAFLALVRYLSIFTSVFLFSAYIGQSLHLGVIIQCYVPVSLILKLC
jgi:hypothetical protein